MSPLKESASSGTRSKGGRASAASAPRTRAASWRRQPESSLAQPAKRWTGSSAPAVRNNTVSGASVIAARHRLGQAAHAQPLDPPGIGIEHFETDPGGVFDHLAARGD